MRRLSTILYVFTFLATACSNESEEGSDDNPSNVVEAPQQSEAPEQETPAGPDRDAPILADALEYEVLSWGRVRWRWTAAVDDVTSRLQMSYHLRGRAGSLVDADPPTEIEPPRGSIEHLVTGPVTHSVWTVVAVDEAGNPSNAIPARHLLARPRLHNLLSRAIDGELRECIRSESELLCVGELGRYAAWDGTTWREDYVDTPSVLRAEPGAQGGVVVIGDDRRYEWTGDGLTPIEDTFEGEASAPLGQFTREPSGLAFWLDADGHLWGSDDNRFRPLANPLLVDQAAGCTAFNDIFFAGSIGFAWCRDGGQYVMRTEQRGYSWTALTEAHMLSAQPRTQRSYTFGAGRQITMLTWGGEVLRYEMGGWRTLLEPTTFGRATTMSVEEDDRRLLIGTEQGLVGLTPLGEVEEPIPLPLRAPPIYIDPPGEERLIVSSIGELYELSAGELRYTPPGGGFTNVVRSGQQIVGAWATSGEKNLFYKWRSPHWSVREVSSGQPEMTITSEILLPNGTFLLGGESLEHGGRVMLLTPQAAMVEPFLYPPPPPEIDPALEGELPVELGPDGLPLDGAPLDEEGAPTSLPEAVPTSLPEATSQPTEPPPLEGVLPALLPVPPAVPPPITALDWDFESGTAVAVGMGGSIWYRMMFQADPTVYEPPILPPPLVPGWRTIPTEVVTPFTTVAVTGQDTYVVGGVNGLLLSCVEAVCEVMTTDAGDIRRFVRTPERLIAVGADKLLELTTNNEWTEVSLQYAPPYPRGEEPTSALGVAEHGQTRWVLASDGSIWTGQRDQPLWAMGLVEQPVDIWLDQENRVVVLTADTMYRIDPPGWAPNSDE